MSTFNYSFDKLYGPGTTCSIDLVAGTTYTFDITNNSGSSHFVLETVKNVNGFYNSASPRNLSGSLTNFSNIAYHVADDYKAGFVLPTNANSFDFTPAINVAKETLLFRGTGGIILGDGGTSPSVLTVFNYGYSTPTGSIRWDLGTAGEAKCGYLYATTPPIPPGVGLQGQVLESYVTPVIGTQMYDILGIYTANGVYVVNNTFVYTLTLGVVTNIETFASLPACV